MPKRKSILIFALSRTPWIGGIYYRKNIINMIMRSDVKNRYKIVLITNKKYYEVFSTFKNDILIELCPDNTNIGMAIFKSFYVCLKEHVKYVFPIMPSPLFSIFGITPVSWIADFQHCHYPLFFEKKEIDKRNRDFRKMANAHNPLVLSSEDSYEDLKKYFNRNRKNVHVLHFSSCIDDEIIKMNKLDKNKVLHTYGLFNEKYCMVCNQFWEHKNHILVFQAIEILLKKYPNNTLKFVFTGELSERRNPNYISSLMRLLEDRRMKERVLILGFVNREEQLLLMKESLFIIQPSLFEGWGTTVEDAKILGKGVLLSDIPVHKEQSNDNCLLFKKDDPDELADIINEVIETDYFKKAKKQDNTEHYAKKLDTIFI